MKAKHGALTAAVLLALGAPAGVQASVAPDEQLSLDIASGQLIEEGIQIAAELGLQAPDRVVVAKAAPKKRSPSK